MNKEVANNDTRATFSWRNLDFSLAKAFPLTLW
jgi:hypothetical protein